MRDGIDVEFREVGLRDGLQNVEGFFPTNAKIAWLNLEIEAGMPAIEVCSFVPPKLIPQFQDALEVVAAARRPLPLAERVENGPRSHGFFWLYIWVPFFKLIALWYYP